MLVPAGDAWFEDRSEDPAFLRRAYVPSFYIDAKEATVEQYRECVSAGVCNQPDVNLDVLDESIDPETAPYPSAYGAFCNYDRPARVIPTGDEMASGTGGTEASSGDTMQEPQPLRDPEQHPINCTTWEDARDYCRLRGGRLPRKCEWIRAARGDGIQRFPWGNDLPTCEHAVLFAAREIEHCDYYWPWDSYSGRWRTCDASLSSAFEPLLRPNPEILSLPCNGFSTEVDERDLGVSIFGVYNMAGNLREWLGEDDECAKTLLDRRPVVGGSFFDVDSGAGTSWDMLHWTVGPDHWSDRFSIDRSQTYRRITVEEASQLIGVRCVYDLE